jgi:hypothetical protein
MDLETLAVILGVAVTIETVMLIILWLKNNAQREAVVLEPGKDTLQVDYYWMSIEDMYSLHNDRNIEDPEHHDFSNQFEENGGKIYKTKEFTYIYDVERPPIIVSRERSLIKSFENAAKYNINDLPENEDDPSEESLNAKTGTIKPPSGLRRPPGLAALVAIEITVRGEGTSYKR